jgi:hypothetical protein
MEFSLRDTLVLVYIAGLPLPVTANWGNSMGRRAMGNPISVTFSGYLERSTIIPLSAPLARKLPQVELSICNVSKYIKRDLCSNP